LISTVVAAIMPLAACLGEFLEFVKKPP